MMSILFSLQKYNREKGCNYNNDASAHLIYRRSALSQGNKHTRRAHDIARCWDGQQQWIYLRLQRSFSSIFGSRRHWNLFILCSLSRSKSCLDKIDKKAGKLTHKHIGALEIRMCKDRRLTVVIIDLNLVLRFHDNGVARSKEEHGQHDAIKFAVANCVSSISFFSHINYDKIN